MAGRLSPVLIAALWLLSGLMLLDIMSAFIKVLLPRYSVLELSAYRNLVGMIPSLIWLYLVGELRPGKTKWRIRQWRLALSRGLMVTAAQMFYYFALGTTAFAVVAALGYTYAMFLVAFSAIILGEQVGKYRWGAVSLGFVGALMIVRPNADDFGLISILPLAAAAFYALSSSTIRLMDDDVSSPLMYLYSSFAALVASMLLVLFFGGFAPLESLRDGAMILAMGLVGGCGVLCLMLSIRTAEPSILAPFNYFGLISAFCIGWFVFGERPFDRLFPGVILIVVAGLLVFWRERVRARQNLG